MSPGPIDGADAMTPEQAQLVKSSFAKVAATKEHAAALFYRRLFELDPSLRPLFKGDMAAQGAKLMAALSTVVASLDRLEKILPAVRDLGRRHATYGVRPDHYATVGDALIWTLEQGLGADFTREMRRAWTDAYVHLAWTMIAAAEDDAIRRAA
jgi:hemoglobin-like flavoprotein